MAKRKEHPNRVLFFYLKGNDLMKTILSLALTVTFATNGTADVLDDEIISVEMK